MLSRAMVAFLRAERSRAEGANSLVLCTTPAQTGSMLILAIYRQTARPYCLRHCDRPPQLGATGASGLPRFRRRGRS